jgi:S-adenosylmethionine synthetase
VRILSRIGNPIDQPLIASAAVVMEKGARLTSVRGDLESIMDDSLADVRRVTNLILQKKVELF